MELILNIFIFIKMTKLVVEVEGEVAQEEVVKEKVKEVVKEIPPQPPKTPFKKLRISMMKRRNTSLIVSKLAMNPSIMS